MATQQVTNVPTHSTLPDPSTLHEAHLKESLQPNLPIRERNTTTDNDVPSHILSSELDRSDSVLGCDFRDVIKEALRLAGVDSWEVRLNCPDGKRRTVKQIIRQFNRSGYEGSAYFDFASAEAR